MRVYLSIFYFLFISILGFSQETFSVNDYQLDDHKMIFGIRSEAYNNSNALTSLVMNKVMYGGHIDAQQKQNILDRSQGINISGTYWNSSIYFAKKIDSLLGKKFPASSYYINVAHHQEDLAAFSENALHLLLEGNKAIAGKSVSMIPLNFIELKYTQFQLGLIFPLNNDNQFNFGFSFLYGHANKTALTQRLDVLTSSSGDRLSVDAEFLLKESEPNQGQIMPYKGAGASLDLGGEFKIELFPSLPKMAKFYFSLNNLGFINWFENSVETKVDTFYTYKGLYIENIFDPSSFVENNDPNQIWDEVSTRRKSKFTTYVPATLNFNLNQPYKNWQFTLGGSHRVNAYYFPFFYGKAGYNFYDAWRLTSQINYGGYGKVGGGLEILHQGKFSTVKLGSSNIEGFIAPSKLAGQSIYLLLSRKL